METWQQMNRRGASGVDGETTTEFERELETRVQGICARLKAGTYRAPPVRRVEIPKGLAKVGTRPLGRVQRVWIHRLNRRASLLNLRRQRNEETGIALGPGLQSWSSYRVDLFSGEGEGGTFACADELSDLLFQRSKTSTSPASP
jgi:hypothetical protein